MGFFELQEKNVRFVKSLFCFINSFLFWSGIFPKGWRKRFFFCWGCFPAENLQEKGLTPDFFSFRIVNTFWSCMKEDILEKRSRL